MATLGFDALVVDEDAGEGMGAADFAVDDEGVAAAAVFWVEEDAADGVVFFFGGMVRRRVC